MAAGVAGTIAALSIAGHNVVVAIGAAAVLAVGILVSAPLFLPAVLRGVGVVVGRIGVTCRLATHNVVRNPARAAATCTALMLGVGLIVTLQVGAASLKATTNDTLNVEFPVDITLTNPAGPLARCGAAGPGPVAGDRSRHAGQDGRRPGAQGRRRLGTGGTGRAPTGRRTRRSRPGSTSCRTAWPWLTRSRWRCSGCGPVTGHTEPPRATG